MTWSRCYFFSFFKWKIESDSSTPYFRHEGNFLIVSTMKATKVRDCISIVVSSKREWDIFLNQSQHYLRMYNNRYRTEKVVLQIIPDVEVQRIKVRVLELPILFKIPWPILFNTNCMFQKFLDISLKSAIRSQRSNHSQITRNKCEVDIISPLDSPGPKSILEY